MKLSGGKKNKQKKDDDKGVKTQKNASDNKTKTKKTNTAGKKVLIAVLAVIAVVLASFVGVGVYANSGELIYPNVSYEGVDLSGLTVAEAADKLSEDSLGTDGDRELTVFLPASVEFTVSAKEAGCYLSAPDAAVFAFETCRGGSFFGNTMMYLKCLFGGLELTVGDGVEVNEEYLQRIVGDAAKQVQLALLDSNLEISEDAITVIKGASSVQVDANELYEGVKAALLAGEYGSMEYNAIPASGAEEELDLDKLYDTIFVEPVNSVYDPETMGATESANGRSFDMTEARRLWDSAKPGDRVVIPLIITEPEITTEKLSSMLFADLLAQKSTSLGGSTYARINNIKKASEAINGLVLNPGEEFSYNGIVGQRTAEKGYMAAGAYNNGQVVQEVGGGICQVSSTLYYCALISNLEITNRLCHYFGVDYLPAGLDATVSWPAPDFKFKNSTEYPIRIDAYVDSSSNACVIKIYGSNPDGIRVEMTTEPLYFADGYGAVSYRWVYDNNGVLLSKTEESRSRYYYHVEEEEEEPSPSPSPEASPSPSPGVPASPSPSTPVSPSPSEPVSPSPSAPVSPSPSTPVSPPPTSGVDNPTDPDVLPW